MSPAPTIPLGCLARTRSGDKGNHANLGVVAKSPAAFEFLRRELTSERVAAFFAGLDPSGVERYELPRVGALNFMLRDVLAGGASRSLRIDTQGKLLGTAALQLPLPWPDDPRLTALLGAPELPAPLQEEGW
jgi:hypothetical protein